MGWRGFAKRKQFQERFGPEGPSSGIRESPEVGIRDELQSVNSNFFHLLEILLLLLLLTTTACLHFHTRTDRSAGPLETAKRTSFLSPLQPMRAPEARKTGTRKPQRSRVDVTPPSKSANTARDWPPTTPRVHATQGPPHIMCNDPRHQEQHPEAKSPQ